MKATITFLFISLFTISLFAQETEEKENQENANKELTEEKDAPVQEQELTTQEGENYEELEDNSSETKSFTLDANDAVVEEVSISETEPIKEEITQSSGTETYHYTNYKRHDEIQTLGGQNSHNGGFGAVSFRASEFNDKDIIMIGFRGGWIINRALAIGFEGYGVIPTAEYENIDPNNPLNSRAVGGYGGMFLEPIIFSNKVVHVTFPIAAGGGWMGYIVDWEQTNYYIDDLIDDDAFWYVEPGAALELNVARNFRINMGASYRFVNDLELISTSSKGFDAWNYFLTLKFGSF